MQALKIVGLCVAAAVLYGVLHDQITVRVCLEYFTIGHPPVFPTRDPTLLALGWGVIATWWVGLSMGLLLAAAARVGRRPRRDAATLVRPIALLMATAAVFASLAGAAGWLLASAGGLSLVGPLAGQAPLDRQTAFLAALWAHGASYLVGFVGGGVLIVDVWRSRGGRGMAGAWGRFLSNSRTPAADK